MAAFTEKLNELIQLLHTNNGELSEYSGVDKSVISRMRTGNRRMATDSIPLNKAASGAVRLAEAKGITDELLALIGADSAAGEDETKARLIEWLFDGDELSDKMTNRENDRKNRYEASRKYAVRLDDMIKLAGVSPAFICERTGIDPAAISRFRQGKRAPKYNSWISTEIAAILWEQLGHGDKQESLAAYMGFPADALGKKLFYQWLYDYKNIFDEASEDARSLLVAMDSMDGAKEINLPDLKDIISQPEPDPDGLYHGKEGLQRAVIRFLSYALEERPEELHLYSDENMKWMTEKDFFEKWAALMYACVKSGIRIRIIHNIDRSMAEMNNAIISWLPLYSTGMVEPYYSTKENGERFSHTMFIIPGKACILGSHVRGMEDVGVYRYYSEELDVSRMEKGFERLISDSQRLVRFERGESIPEDPKATVYDLPFNTLNRMEIGKDYVRIIRKGDPDVSIMFSHPLMCRAFRGYATTLK